MKNIRVDGESEITKTPGEIKRVWLEPSNPHAYPPAIQSILSADLVIIGPGSLYTSILPNLLVPDIVEALRVSRALKFFICNVATQKGETDGYLCGDHVTTIEKHLGQNIFDLIICNKSFKGSLPSDIDWVISEPDLSEKYSVYYADLIDEKYPWRHDSDKLSRAIIDLYYERTGPLLLRDD